MPINMNPKNRRQKDEPPADEKAGSSPQDPNKVGSKQFGEENEDDRQKALADAEWKNLWDATEVIDMDTW